MVTLAVYKARSFPSVSDTICCLFPSRLLFLKASLAIGSGTAFRCVSSPTAAGKASRGDSRLRPTVLVAHSPVTTAVASEPLILYGEASSRVMGVHCLGQYEPRLLLVSSLCYVVQVKGDEVW